MTDPGDDYAALVSLIGPDPDESAARILAAGWQAPELHTHSWVRNWPAGDEVVCSDCGAKRAPIPNG